MADRSGNTERTIIVWVLQVNSTVIVLYIADNTHTLSVHRITHMNAHKITHTHIFESERHAPERARDNLENL